MKIENIKDHTVSIEDVLSRAINMRAVSHDDVPVDKNLVANNPGYYTPYQSAMPYEDGTVDLFGGEDMSWLCVDMDEYLDAHKRVIKNPAEIRDFTNHLTPLRSCLDPSFRFIPGITKKFEEDLGYNTFEQFEQFFKEKIDEASDSALIRTIFGFSENNDAHIRFYYSGNQESMQSYMDNQVLKDYTEKYFDDDGTAIINNKIDDIPLTVGRKNRQTLPKSHPDYNSKFQLEVQRGGGQINFDSVSETVFPKNDGNDVLRGARIEQLVNSLRAYDQMENVYLNPGTQTPILAAWQREPSAKTRYEVK